jgi:tetratricopeptide (TPR) repeat protein
MRLSCITTAIIAGVLGLFIERPQAAIAGPEAKDVEALISYYEHRLLPRGGRIGHMESLGLKRDALRWIGDVLEHASSSVPPPDVISYVSERTLDPSFRSIFVQAIREETTLAASATEFAGIATETKSAWDDAKTLRYWDKISDEEKNRLLRNASVPERIDNLREWVRYFFVQLSELEQKGSATRGKVYKLVRDDLAKQYAGATGALVNEMAVLRAMEDAYLKSPLLNDPTTGNQTLGAQIATVEASRQKIPGKTANVPYSALRFEQTPMEWLARDVRLSELLDATISFDDDLFQLLSMPVVKQEKYLASDLDGLYDIRGSLERSRLLAVAGRPALSFQIMIDVAESILAAHAWADRDAVELKQDGTRTTVSWDGYSSLQLATLQRTIEHLRQYRDSWLHDRNQPPLYAAIEVDDTGQRIWHLGGWLLWDWLTTAGLQYFQAQQRIVSVGGKRWLLPEGQTARQFDSVPKLLAAVKNVKEISLAVDLNGDWAQAEEAWEKLTPAEKAYAAGNWAFEHDEIDDAEQSYSTAIRLEPVANYYLSRGNARLALMHYNDASQDYDRAIQLQPSYAPSYLARGTLAALLGRLSAAEDDLKLAVRLQPDNEFYHSRLAEVLIDEDKQHDRTELYRRAFKQDNSRAWALEGLLSGLFVEKRFDEIMTLVSTNLRGDVYVSWLYYYAARVDEARKDLNSALQSYREAVNHDSDDLIPIEARFRLASIERDMQLSDDCDKHLQEYQRRMGQPEYDKKWCYK